jgi:hypothetical protein
MSNVELALSILGAVVTLGGSCGAAYGLGRRAGRTEALKSIRAERHRQRLERLYAPLRALLIDVHLTTATLIKYPSVGARLRHAWRMRKLQGVRQAMRALADKGSSSSHEVEYGGDFPLQEIADIVKANAEVADPELMQLVQRARRARYEDPPASNASDVTDEEMALAYHVLQQFARLEREVT